MSKQYPKQKQKQILKNSDLNPKTDAIKINNHIFLMLILAVVTFLCFSNTLKNEFVNWDDDRNFYEHPAIKDLSKGDFGKATKYIFTNNVIGNYNPLTNWTFAIEKVVFGFDKPMYWHLNNLLLHLIAVLLVFKISTLLGLSWRGALFTSLLFAIHPMRVESVAWVTERKDVLFGAFYLAALYQYIKYVQDSKQTRWIWMTLFFILSLLSKIQAVSLPLSMLAVDYLLKKEIRWSHLIQKIPFLILSLIFGLIGVYMLKEFGSLESASETTQFSFIQRLFIGSFSFSIYLIKLIIPYEMSPLYPYPSSMPWHIYLSMIILPVVLYTLYWSFKKHKIVFFGLSFFIVNIIFLLQILGAGQGFLADRFTYIAYFGFFFMFGYFLDRGFDNFPKYKNAIIACAGILLGIYAVMTFNQNKIWKDSGTLWTHVLKYYKSTTLPYGNRANFYRDKGMIREALSDYNTNLALKDNQPQAYNSRAKLYFTIATTRDTLLMALSDYNKAIEYLPTEGEFYVNRGATYARLGDIPKAIEDLNKGLQLKPDHAVGYLNRSIMYNASGKIDLALADIESYLKINPYNADIWYEKGRALRLLERTDLAMSAYNEAIRLNNKNPLFYYERAKANYILQNVENAKSDFRAAVSLGYPEKDIDRSFQNMLGL